MNLSYQEILWLNQHGDRISTDVCEDKKGKYVWMGNGEGGDMKVHLPEKHKLDFIRQSYSYRNNKNKKHEPSNDTSNS